MERSKEDGEEERNEQDMSHTCKLERGGGEKERREGKQVAGYDSRNVDSCEYVEVNGEIGAVLV
jgi:hypothetical protein